MLIFVQAFLTFDHDKNGYLNLLELQKVLCSIGEALSTREAAIVLKAVDTNNDGKVDVEGEGRGVGGGGGRRYLCRLFRNHTA